MTDSTFAPSTVEMKVGETVSFVDKDEIAHTATAEATFDSGTLREGERFDFKATKPGTISYVCIFHPGMTGTINVRANAPRARTRPRAWCAPARRPRR